jgi:hypothetical protein
LAAVYPVHIWFKRHNLPVELFPLAIGASFAYNGGTAPGGNLTEENVNGSQENYKKDQGSEEGEEARIGQAAQRTDYPQEGLVQRPKDSNAQGLLPTRRQPFSSPPEDNETHVDVLRPIHSIESC